MLPPVARPGSRDPIGQAVQLAVTELIASAFHGEALRMLCRSLLKSFRDRLFDVFLFEKDEPVVQVQTNVAKFAVARTPGRILDRCWFQACSLPLLRTHETNSASLKASSNQFCCHVLPRDFSFAFLRAWTS